MMYHDYHDYHEYDDYGGYDDCGDYDGGVIAGVTSTEEYQECDVILSDVVPPQTDPDVSIRTCDHPCHAPTQFRPLMFLLRRFGIQPIAPRLMLLR